MWKFLGFSILILLLLVGCARKWDYPQLDKFAAGKDSLSAVNCGECHEDEHNSWKETKHADSARMQKVTHEQLRECAACHDNLAAHTDDPSTNLPPSLPELTKTEQNLVCGKCHYNQELFGRKAINPHDRHGLFMSVGFEGKKRQISCLDCHSGHKGKSDMLQSIKAHTCFKCHKEAIVTMGVFQLPNYLFFGKICVSCHTAHGGSTVNKVARATTGTLLICLPCHVSGD
jgi:predicted CXXCH cytochrome family protein